jgi:hypothetical protein
LDSGAAVRVPTASLGVEEAAEVAEALAAAIRPPRRTRAG